MIKRIVQKIKNKKIGKNKIIFYLPDEKKSRLRAFARTRAKKCSCHLVINPKFNIKPTLIELINTKIKCVVELIDNVCLFLISEHINLICCLAFFVLSSTVKNFARSFFLTPEGVALYDVTLLTRTDT